MAPLYQPTVGGILDLVHRDWLPGDLLPDDPLLHRVGVDGDYGPALACLAGPLSQQLHPPFG